MNYRSLFELLEKDNISIPCSVAEQAGNFDLYKEQKFYSLPTRYNKIRRFFVSRTFAVCQLLSAIYTGHILKSFNLLRHFRRRLQRL